MKFKQHRISRLNESVCKSLGITDDKKVDVVGTLNPTEVGAVNSEIELKEKQEEVFETQEKTTKEFIEENHDRDTKVVKDDGLKKMKLSESLFEDCEEDVDTSEIFNEEFTYDEPTNFGKGHTAPLVADYTSDITQLVKMLSDGDKDFALPSLKRIVARIIDNEKQVHNFNKYWTERYEAAIPFIDNQLSIIPQDVYNDIVKNLGLEESVVTEATAVAEPETKKRTRAPNEVKEKGNFSSEDLWLAVYDELSAEVDNEGEGKEVNKQLKARRGERYEKVLPIGDSDIVVYATKPEEFEFAKKVAEYYEVTYDEPKLDKNKATNDYYKYSMRIHIPMEDLYDWDND